MICQPAKTFSYSGFTNSCRDSDEKRGGRTATLAIVETHLLIA